MNPLFAKLEDSALIKLCIGRATRMFCHLDGPLPGSSQRANPFNGAERSGGG